MTSEEAVLYLIRTALGGEPISVSPLDASSVRWREVMKIASRQGVLVLCMDGVERLPADFRPPMNLLLQWVGQTARYESLYGEHLDIISHLASFYRSIGVRMMLLKGYGLSRYWPKPDHRPIGDIDIYLFGQWKNADKALAEKFGIAVSNEHHHHSVFTFEGTMVENHYDFINVHSHRSNRAIEATFKRLAEMGGEEDPLIPNLCYPQDILNMLFVARHNAVHFAAEHLTLRQLLDWAFLARHVASVPSFDYAAFWREVEATGMLPFVRCMNAVCVQHLGFDREIFCEPSLAALPDDLPCKMLSDIFSQADTGADKKGLAYLVHRIKLWWANRWKHRMVYSDSLLSTFFVQLKSHLMKPRTIFRV